MKSPLATTPPVLSNASFAAPALPQRQVRSFVRRAGRTTAAQARAFEQFGPEFLIPFQPSLSTLAALYPQLAGPELGAAPISGAPAPPHPKLVLEIGFGMGEATAHIAALMPDVDFLCCEVHPPGVGALLKRIGESGLHNVRIIAHDAVEVMEQMLPLWQASAPARGLDGVHLFFPDPWHKKRHNKRRLIQPELVAKLAARLKPGGVIHCATDWQPYAEQMLSVLGSELLLCNTATTGQSEPDGFVPRPHYRPLTKFEQRGLRLGHGVWDLLFERV